FGGRFRFLTFWNLFVGSTFWILYAIDREVIYPKSLDAILPFWFNHLLHSITIPLTLADRYIIKTCYPEFKRGISATLLFMATYLLWLLFVSSVSGVWVYPIFNVLDTTKKTIFILICALLFSGFYGVGNALNKLLW
ncbi:hypothetical protein HELRODRAFT_136306, partial [Helobdella robusta]|uniref:Androgen-dependent TFPI-regulating protein n=1 Tax=Helobdella robusta TaxID=6412 RepID=T1EID2_HELRO